MSYMHKHSQIYNECEGLIQKTSWWLVNSIFRNLSSINDVILSDVFFFKVLIYPCFVQVGHWLCKVWLVNSGTMCILLGKLVVVGSEWKIINIETSQMEKDWIRLSVSVWLCGMFECACVVLLYQICDWDKNQAAHQSEISLETEKKNWQNWRGIECVGRCPLHQELKKQEWASHRWRQW